MIRSDQNPSFFIHTRQKPQLCTSILVSYNVRAATIIGATAAKVQVTCWRVASPVELPPAEEPEEPLGEGLGAPLVEESPVAEDGVAVVFVPFKRTALRCKDPKTSDFLPRQ